MRFPLVPQSTKSGSMHATYRPFFDLSVFFLRQEFHFSSVLRAILGFNSALRAWILILVISNYNLRYRTHCLRVSGQNPEKNNNIKQQRFLTCHVAARFPEPGKLIFLPFDTHRIKNSHGKN